MEDKRRYKYLGRINTPSDIKKMPREELDGLFAETRKYLVERVTKNGGHLSSNLGVVELTAALLRNFDFPNDHIVFDVGHQSYTYKLFTERFDKFDTLREPGGISGFPKMSESRYDCYGAGHSSVSISAALGIARADKLAGKDTYTVAIVGDGAFTGGIIHEALNNVAPDLKLIIIINENEMSISRNIGRFAKSLAKMRRTPGYISTKRATGRAVRNIPFIGNGVYNVLKGSKQLVKNALYGSNIFEDLGLYYLGPADGNDYDAVEALIKEAKSQNESVIIHLKTKKGKGFEKAETNPGLYHGLPQAEAKRTSDTFSKHAGAYLSKLADTNRKLVAITAAMCDGTGLTTFKKKHPDRFYDVGIAEEHAVAFAAGLAANGMKPAVDIYSTFLQRCYDQMLIEVAIQKLPVVFCIDRAGLGGRDGITHYGIYDVAFISQLPGFEILAPVTYRGLEDALRYASKAEHPVAVRYPNSGELECMGRVFLPDGNAAGIKVRRSPSFGTEKLDAVIVTYGNVASEAVLASEKLKDKNVGILLCERLAPYGKLADEIISYLPDGVPVIFLEEGIKNGGFSMLLYTELSSRREWGSRKHKIIAIENGIINPRYGENLFAAAGIDAAAVIKAVGLLTEDKE